MPDYEVHNFDSAKNLKDHLSLEQASAMFDSNGVLKQEFVTNSRLIVKGTKINSQKVIKTLTAGGSKIEDWAKFTTTDPIKTVSGNVQFHFYMNKKTNMINTEIDYKFKQ